MAHRISSPLMVFRFSWTHRSEASLVINAMNSDTHSWTHSLASLAILAFSGRARFIIRATLAIGRSLSWSAESSIFEFDRYLVGVR